MKLTLHNYWRSSCSWRVRIALAHKGLEYRYAPIHLTRGGGEQNTERYRALNPVRTVPMLEIDDGGTVRRLTQSMAILEFLEEIQPEPRLLPVDPFARAQVRALAELVNSGIQPLQNLMVLQRVKNELQSDDKSWSQHWIQRGLVAFETLVSVSAGRFCVGDAPSFADVCLVPQLGNARRYEVDLSPYPTLLRIEAECGRLPAFEAARPERQPDAAA